MVQNFAWMEGESFKPSLRFLYLYLLLPAQHNTCNSTDFLLVDYYQCYD